MQLTPKTLKILENFNKINKSLLFREGNVLTTISPTKTIYGRAEVDNSFDRSFAIYDLSKFLSVHSLFGDPELVFDEKQLTFSKGKNKIKYTYASPDTIVTPPDKKLALDVADVQFTITDDMFSSVMKSMSILSLPEMALVGEDGVMKLKALDTKDPSGDTFEVEVGETDKSFSVIFKGENLKIIPGTYEVSVSKRLISKFVSKEIEYFIAVEQSSVFE